MVEAVAIVVGGNQLQDGELAPEWDGQVDAQTEAGGGGEGQPETGAVTSQTPHSFTGRHVVQHVCLQQARLLLHGAQQRCYFNETNTYEYLCSVVSQLYWRSEIRRTAPITDFEIREKTWIVAGKLCCWSCKQTCALIPREVQGKEMNG